jgi:hypothetical protein
MQAVQRYHWFTHFPLFTVHRCTRTGILSPLVVSQQRWRYSNPPPHGNQREVDYSQSQSYVTTDSESASLSWCQAPIWDLRPDFYYCQTVAGSLMWGSLSDEWTYLPFTIAAGLWQRSHSWVRVPRDSWPYFTVTHSKLPQPGGPSPRIYVPQEQGGPVISLFVAFYDSQGCRRLLLASSPAGTSENLLITYGHGPHIKHRSFIFALVSITAETCLPNRCSQTGCKSPFS